jgi:hypothetical protein
MPIDARSAMAMRLENHFYDRVVRCFAKRPHDVNQMRL